MAENIFLALKGIKLVVPWTQMLSIKMFCTPKNYFFVLFTFVGKVCTKIPSNISALKKSKKKPALHLHSSQRDLAQFAYPPPTLT